MEREIVIKGRKRHHGLLLRLAVNTIALYLMATILPGVHIGSIWAAALVALVLAAVNTFIRPILILLTLPLTIVTLGLFLLVINGLTLLLVAGITGDHFSIAGFGSAILAWLVFWIVNWLLSSLLTPASD